jgi:hypothetical protein
MKGSMQTSVIQMEEKTFMHLVAEVNETLAIVDLPQRKKQSFGIVDMWNIRRSGKSATSMLKR